MREGQLYIYHRKSSEQYIDVALKLDAKLAAGHAAYT